MRAERRPPVPIRPPASRLTALAILSLVALGAAACDEAVVEDPLTPSPVASRIDAASPPPASQVAVDNSLGAWRSGPIALVPTVQEAVVEACRTAPVSGFADGAGDGPGDLPVAVVDARGLGRVTIVFADDTRWSACLATIDADGNVTVTAAGQPGDATAGPVGDDEITIAALEVLDDLDAAQRSLLIGRVGKNSFGTVAGFDDETYVDGPYANGWYAMWWPGNVEAAAVSSIDRGRVSIGSVNPRQ
jgi:hypothetical protein